MAANRHLPHHPHGVIDMRFTAGMPRPAANDAAREGRGAGADGARHALAVLRARMFMETHVGDTMTLADIARAACMSRFHLARRFRMATGQSPMQYLLALRIGRAKELLQDPRRSLSAIALELGFFDQSHFTRSFRRATGTTPGAYLRSRITQPSAHGAGTWPAYRLRPCTPAILAQGIPT